MSVFGRTDTSVLGRWWWTIDRFTFIVVVILAALGGFISFSASPAVAERIGVAPLHFVQRHWLLLPIALMLMIAVSLLPLRLIKRLGLVLCLGGIIGVALTLLVGIEIKGARRWLHLPGLSLQPSEFLKIGLVLVTAWLLSEPRQWLGRFSGLQASMALMALVAGFMVLQPDMGMTVVMVGVWFGQLFLFGLPMLWVMLLLGVGATGLVGSYFTLPHVTSRIDRFLNPESGDTYQIARAMEAFAQGGWLGRGPGEGLVKLTIPDAHADFVLAVVGEELGLLITLLLLGLYATLLVRGLNRLREEKDMFIILAAGGMLMQFGAMVIINIASELALMPTKGMTLPLLSYGGSALFSTALTLGFYLGLTRKRPQRGGR